MFLNYSNNRQTENLIKDIPFRSLHLPGQADNFQKLGTFKLIPLSQALVSNMGHPY